MLTRKFGWIPDVPDKRDYLLFDYREGKIPAEASIRPLCSPVEDQGELGSCTANAGAGALEYLERKNKKKFFDFSRLFLYYNTRILHGTVLFDSGASIRNTVKAMAKFGVCPEPDWPYDIAKFARRPPLACYRKGFGLQVTSYLRLESPQTMKSCIADGYPFIFGFSVYESFMSAKVAKTGTANLPGTDEKLLGGHAVMAVGYSDKTERFTVRNSWGAAWGKKGYFTLPYAYLADRDLSDDFWTIKAGEKI